MDNIKGDKYYANKAIDNIKAIEKYVDNISYEEFIGDDVLVDAIMFRLVQLIENVKNISLAFKATHEDVPWGKIIGFRNGIVHEYGSTNYETVYVTITNDLDELKTVLSQIQ